MSSARSVGAFRDPLMEEARRRRVGIVAFCGASVGRGIFGTVKSGLYMSGVQKGVQRLLNNN